MEWFSGFQEFFVLAYGPIVSLVAVFVLVAAIIIAVIIIAIQ